EARWRIEMFGGLRALCGELVVTRFETQRTAALLAYLALHPDGAHPREVLCERIWPEEDPDATRVRFRQALAALRRALDPAPAKAGTVLIANRAEVRLNSEAVSIDVAEFERLIRRAERTRTTDERTALLEQAVGIQSA